MMIRILWVSTWLISYTALAANPAKTGRSSDDWSRVECNEQTRIVVDCGKHEVSLMGGGGNLIRSTIDCGKPGLTKNGRGTIGERFTPQNYSVVGEAIDIRGISGMGSPPFGTGQVFHVTPPFNQPRSPSARNSSLGCIHVEKDVLMALSRCEGASLEIMNAVDGGSNPAPYQAPPTWSYPGGDEGAGSAR